MDKIIITTTRSSSSSSSYGWQRQFTPYDIVECLVFLWPNSVPLREEIPLERGHQTGLPPKKSLFYHY